jgi:zinc transport system permease protein
MNYLFGNILMVSSGDLWLIAALDLVVLVVVLACYDQLVAVCFDEEFARLRGLPVEAYYLLLLCLTAVTVVLLVTVVGIVLVIALLTLPAATAGFFTSSLWRMMLWAAALCALFTTSGLALSYGPDLPAGSTTIVLAGGVYLVVALAAWVRRRRAA